MQPCSDPVCIWQLAHCLSPIQFLSEEQKKKKGLRVWSSVSFKSIFSQNYGAQCAVICPLYLKTSLIPLLLWLITLLSRSSFSFPSEFVSHGVCWILVRNRKKVSKTFLFYRPSVKFDLQYRCVAFLSQCICIIHTGTRKTKCLLQQVLPSIKIMVACIWKQILFYNYWSMQIHLPVSTVYGSVATITWLKFHTKSGFKALIICLSFSV